MRGTKHDASQHQRRGIRSRLIASVAAVAMLATSIAAGTAVAADIDEAEPTQQNTIVEQTQQGAENAGDQTGEQNTESEGDQTDRPQGSGDTATETESDNAAEADVTEETTPKTDAGKTDINQSAEKQSAAVPAPQAANAANEADAEVSAQADTTGSVLLDESFRGTTADSRWKAYGDACLTAAALQNSFGAEGRQLAGCAKGHTTDTNSLIGSGVGNNPKAGFLQLTDNQGSASGNVLFDRAIPTSAGLDIQFYQYQYATSDNGLGPADGIGFFLTDGDYTMSEPGPDGASLGYAPLENSGEDPEDGIAYGVLGVGLDVYGNYSSTLANGDNTSSCPAGPVSQQRPNSVALRGEGNGRDGYCLLASAQQYKNNNGRINLETGAAQAGDSDTNGKLVRIGISPQTESENSTVTVSIDGKVALEYTLTYRLPDKVKFGFSASTGGGHEAHLIRGLKASTVDPLPSGIDLVKSVDKESDLYKGSYQAGDKVPYTFLITNGDGSDLTNITLSDEYLDEGTLECDASLSSLAASDSLTCKGIYTLTEEDTRNGTFTNTATASGEDDQGNTVSDTDDETVNTIPSLGAPDHRKRIRKNDDGTYTLALDATAASVDSTIEGSGKPLDIVLVLDTSGSMAESFGSVTRHVATYIITESKPAWGFGWYQQNAGEYYVLVDGEYKRVHENTEKVWEGNRQFDQHVSWEIDGKVVVPITSQYDTDGKVQFYMKSEESVSRREALQDAANKFIDQIAEKNGTLGQDKKIRVSIVTFADSAELQNGLTECEGDGSIRLKNTVNGLGASGATNAGDGMTKANDQLWDNARKGATQMVVFFTDGVPTTFRWFSEEVANNAVDQAKAIKSRSGIVYSVGIFSGADPEQTSLPNWNVDDTDRANVFMNAVSSNYPNASSWNTLGNRAEGDTKYYKTAADAGALSEVFQDIFDESTQTYTYTDLWITDELSEYAQMADDIEYDESQADDGFYKVMDTGDASVQVWSRSAKESEGTDSTADSFFGTQLGKNQYSLWWNPTTKAIRVKITSPEAGELYTLTFNIKPTDTAVSDYVSKGYVVDQGNGVSAAYQGDEGTDLPGNDTSEGQDGFRSNDRAYVSYRQDSDGEMKTDDYVHPVIQVNSTVLEGDAFATVKKTVEGREWLGYESFTFELTAKDNAPMPVDAQGRPQSSITISKPAKGYVNTAVFGAITYTSAGTYTYTLKEQIPDSEDDRHGLTYSVAEYTITVEVSDEFKTHVTVADSDGKPVADRVASFVNRLAPHEYAETAHLDLRKELVNAPDGTLHENTFSFTLTDVTLYDSDAARLTIKGCDDPRSGCEVTNKEATNGSNIADLKDFGVIKFTEPGTYCVKVVENEDATLDHGYYVFDDRALYVKYYVHVNPDTGVLDMDRSVYRENPGEDVELDEITEDDWTSEVEESMLTWTNTYVAPVSSLPLTGGRSTARTLLLAGGGVLLVAGAAWLLARRRRV